MPDDIIGRLYSYSLALEDECNVYPADLMIEAANEIDGLRDRVAALEAALKPFEALLKTARETGAPENWQDKYGTHNVLIPLGVVETAAATLKGEGTGHEN